MAAPRCRSPPWPAHESEYSAQGSFVRRHYTHTSGYVSGFIDCFHSLVTHANLNPVTIGLRDAPARRHGQCTKKEANADGQQACHLAVVLFHHVPQLASPPGPVY